jgi:hypothetical protein
MKSMDSLTRQYLRRLRHQSGHIVRGTSEKPTRSVFQDENVKLFEENTVDIEGEEAIQVYRFAAHKNPLLAEGHKTGVPEEDIKHHFAVDWPKQTEEGYYYNVTDTFSERPSVEDIQTVDLVHEIRTRVETGDLHESFTCQACSQRVHWTDTTIPTNEEPTLKQRLKMLEHEVCNVSHILDEDLADTTNDNALRGATEDPTQQAQALQKPQQ